MTRKISNATGIQKIVALESGIVGGREEIQLLGVWVKLDKADDVEVIFKAMSAIAAEHVPHTNNIISRAGRDK
jgi:hypothetical protein